MYLTGQVRQDVMKSLRLTRPAEFVQSFNRTNLFFRVEKKPDKAADAMEYVAEYIKIQNKKHARGYESRRFAVAAPTSSTRTIVENSSHLNQSRM